MDLQFNQPMVIGSMRAVLRAPGDLRLEGSLSEEAARRELSRHLREVHDDVVARKVPTFTVDVRGLSFVNSSAIRLFVDLASRAESSGYQLVFDIDSTITWHRLSFSVLASLAPKTVLLRNHGQAARDR